MNGRVLAAGQRCRIRVWERATGALRTVFDTSSRLYEAPNWTRDGLLVLNGDGALWSLPADGTGEPTKIPLGGVPALNNDHVLAPDARAVFLSADDGRIWQAPLTGGRARRITPDDGGRHYLHGVSPDGSELAYVRLDTVDGDRWGSATIHVFGVDSGADRTLTAAPGPADGPEWTPDGDWVLFNTEQFSSAPGHAQLARVRPDGSDLQQLTYDDRVNWFPHPAPTDDAVVYLSYPPGTTGHPANRPVELRYLQAPGPISAWPTSTWQDAETIVSLFGGQGTINVNSWAPDGSAFAFVDYPVTNPVTPTSAETASRSYAP